ncbi:helix-turn-helix transcriptional regulator [Sphaerisporangium flaviroseum]|uniref:Helix-turn-helix transcriptional regulator n=1 Tax=Sphaerisporangium flaviroseum TaxID=509199 RepID=A0ABP7ILV0_9ACTN
MREFLPQLPTFAERLEYLFKSRRRPNGEEWGVRETERAIKASGAKIDHTTISDLRSGASSNPTLRNLVALAQFFGVSRGWLAGDDPHEQWWDATSVPLSFEETADLESRAASIRIYAPLSVPGLLQIEEYARAVCQWICTPGEVEDSVQAILARQEILDRQLPPHLWLVLDEGALLRAPAGVDAQVGQIDALICATKLPRITVQVVPFSRTGRLPERGSFSLLRFPQDEPDVAVVRQANMMDELVTSPRETGRYHEAHTQLAVNALDPTTSREVLIRLRHQVAVDTWQ